MPCCEIHPRVMKPEEEARELEEFPVDWLPPGELQRWSQVADFYDGASILLTGATGFIGTLIIEKLLRSCPGVSTVYVLVRDKKGVPLRERLRSHLEKLIFSNARQACPDYLRKVIPIAGDCTQPGLGISPADATTLTSKVSVVFHVAATVRFDADLRTATLTNVASTCEVVALVKRMTNLKAFVYMSTAYSNAPRDEIEEEFYPPALNAEELLKLLNIMGDEQLAQLLPLILGDWPNTYTFTKAVAEDVICTHLAGLPASVIRPSIVMSTNKEPVAFWVGNMHGPSAMVAGGALGILHTTQSDEDAMADGVPADMVANATIVCAWDTWYRHSRRNLTQLPAPRPLVYNCVSTARHPKSWGTILKDGSYASNFPSIRNICPSYGFMFKQKSAYVIAAVVLHLIPAMIVDTFLCLKGREPILWNVYSRVHGVIQALEKFTTRDWTFKDDNMVAMLGRLGDVDRKLFPCDIVDVDLEWHHKNCVRGLRLYILNESFDNLEAAKKKYFWLTVLHHTVVTIMSSLLLLMLWRILGAQIGQ
ncbi:putative fatty acyl-CoA reductase CG5065 [Schistocerca gregaria]|uniref:putative fatty acyl-CoA reductase CG5065 n=1 Tax=Schistocerca gregaria TaxID=7010 RepID=UPI00211EC0B6|nr:putative fatty acyl-CoA reductase CG5065 [Schistocerca gregaria]XP_049839500.1 putative fatty acyl-CoA reductase CG5065 [Schistocerca gregaria]